jgi:hypothetical protein
MNSEPPDERGEATAAWPWWKVVLAVLWPTIVIVSYLGLVLLPLLFGTGR